MTRGRLYLPEWGKPAPRRRPEDTPERVLSLSLAIPQEPLTDLHRAFGRFGALKRIDWAPMEQKHGTDHVRREIIATIVAYKPTLIWMQVQKPCVLSDAQFLRRMRQHVPANCLFVSWNGDVANHDSGKGITEWYAPWMVELASAVDLFCACQCNYIRALHSVGTPASCGFHQCGVDLNMVTRRTKVPDSPAVGKIVWLAACYMNLVGDERKELAEHIVAHFPGQLVCYGGGWDRVPGAVSAGWATYEESSYIYSHARLAVSISLSSRMQRYTSDRLPRIMASGGVALVKRFPDMESLGCVDGKTCLIWDNKDQLVSVARDWLRPERDGARACIRQAAHVWAHKNMGWDAAVEELAWLVYQERNNRAA